MAKHYYNIEVVCPRFLEEDEIMELEEVIRLSTDRTARVTTEYVDSEG